MSSFVTQTAVGVVPDDDREYADFIRFYFRDTQVPIAEMVGNYDDPEVGRRARDYRRHLASVHCTESQKIEITKVRTSRYSDPIEST